MARPTRSWLFTPGTRPDRFEKAAESGADVLIVDLEDAVAPDEKATARASALKYLGSRRSAALARAVRINGLDTLHGLADMQAIIEAAPDPDFIVLPKVESADHILILDRLLSRAGIKARILGIVESARGLAAIESIAGASERLHGLMFGAADMAADLGAEVSWNSLFYARARIIAACAKARVGAVDSPWFDVRDEPGLVDEIGKIFNMGFAAKAAIHPLQIEPINAAFTPSQEDVEQARAILAENEKGVGVINGRMIDEAVARKARRVLAAVAG